MFACPGSFATKKAYWYHIYSLSFFPISSGFLIALEKIENREFWVSLGKVGETISEYIKYFIWQV